MVNTGSDHQFDIRAYQRERIRELERDNAHLREHRRRLEQLLALTLKVAAGDDCQPRVLLQVIYETEREAESMNRLVQVLRDTDPATIGKRAAAA